MILDSARSLALDPARSVMIGDRWSDIEAGRRAGCRTVLIGDGYGEANPWHAMPDAQVRTLTAAAAWILGQKKEHAVRNATNLNVKLFADGADLASMVKLLRKPADQGLHDQPDADAQGRRPGLRAVCA